MIFKVLLWYALLQGAKKGLKGELPKRDLRWMDRILKDIYLKPIFQQLNQPIDRNLFNFDSIHVEAGSMR